MKIINKYPLTFLDYPDNKSAAISLFIPGCNHKCNGCHSKNIWTYEEAEDIHIEDIISKIRYLGKYTNIDKLVLLGGDPLYDENLENTNYLLKILTDFNICIYTGYDIVESKKRIKGKFKFLKCNKFDITQQVKSEKTDTYIQFASLNQELYNEDFIQISNFGRYYFTEEKC